MRRTDKLPDPAEVVGLKRKQETYADLRKRAKAITAAHRLLKEAQK